MISVLLLYFVALSLETAAEKTIINKLPAKALSPISIGLNTIQSGLGEKGRKKSISGLNYISNSEDYQASEADFNTNSIENEVLVNEIDESLFEITGDTEQDLRKIWEFFARKISGIERRVNQVEEQTSDIRNRLTVIDCSSLPEGSPSGVYTLYLDHRGTHSVRAMCDQDTEEGGWTMILRRLPHASVELATNFSRGIRDYKIGFGKPGGDFWIGLENIHLLTSSRDYQLRVDLEDFNGDTAFAHYDKFYVEHERNGYRLQVSGYRGNAGDSLTNKNNPDNFTSAGMMFSTYDEDRDTSHEINCAQYWDIGGWWYNRCSWANLMGPYRLPETGDGIGINWHKWRNKQYIKAATMMIRPASP